MVVLIREDIQHRGEKRTTVKALGTRTYSVAVRKYGPCAVHACVAANEDRAGGRANSAVN